MKVYISLVLFYKQMITWFDTCKQHLCLQELFSNLRANLKFQETTFLRHTLIVESLKSKILKILLSS